MNSNQQEAILMLDEINHTEFKLQNKQKLEK